MGEDRTGDGIGAVPAGAGSGRVLWEPPGELVEASNLTAYMRWLEERRGLRFASYGELWRWSVDHLEDFWGGLAEHFGVRFHAPPERVLAARTMPGARWFEGARLNYAEHALARADDRPALVYRSEDGGREVLTRAEVAARVARARAGLRRLGVGRGDRVAGFLGNSPEAIVSMLATASLGAVWSSCPPEFGAASVLDRFRQIEPKVLVATDGYPYNGRFHDRREVVAGIVAALPSLEATVVLQRAAAGTELPGAMAFSDLVSEPAAEPLEFESVPFDHPLWILYSSGTTGPPKPIVHGHGGILLEHLKKLALHTDLKAGDRYYWYSTTGWMMWNYNVSGLLVDATVVIYEGAPAWPDLMRQFRLIDEERINYFGTSAPFLLACRRAGISPRSELSLESLVGIGSTGAPLPVEGFEWVYEEVKPDVWLGSMSGGTDVCTAFVGSCPLLPVRAGEIQSIALGVKAEAWDESGRPVVDEVGELVIAAPMPSMPVFFWGDPDGRRYRESYFETYEGVWRHGDWIRFDREGRAVIYGRSDSTLNRGGVRIGTSELYSAVETVPGIVDAVAVDTGALGREGELWLFVVLAEGAALDEALAAQIRAALRERLSPRHVPDEIRAIPEVPKTLSGKKLEVPIKRILTGTPVEKAVNLGTLANPKSVEALLAAIGSSGPSRGA